MIGQNYHGTDLVTSSRRGHVSAFGIDALLGLSSRDVIVTSLKPPPSQPAVGSSPEGRHLSPAVKRSTVQCCCPVVVTSSERFKARVGTPSNHSVDNEVSRAEERHRTGTNTRSYRCLNTCVIFSVLFRQLFRHCPTCQRWKMASKKRWKNRKRYKTPF